MFNIVRLLWEYLHMYAANLILYFKKMTFILQLTIVSVYIFCQSVPFYVEPGKMAV